MTRKEKMSQIKLGDTITRIFAGIEQPMVVTEVLEDRIVAGLGWQFLIETGAEIDEDLGWDGKTMTGSYLKLD